MNTLMKRQMFLASFLFLACAVAIPATSHAQAVAQNPVVELRIENGRIAGVAGKPQANLQNVVKYLQDRDPALNIVLSSEIKNIEIGDLQLRDAPTDLAIQALNVASGNQCSVEERGSPVVAGGNPLFIISKIQPPGPPPPKVLVQAFSLYGYLNHIGLDMVSRQGVTNSDEKLDSLLLKLQNTIKQTIEQEQKLESSAKGGPIENTLPGPEINFYKEADLVVVIGSPAAVDTARTIIRALPGENAERAGGGFAGPRLPAPETK
jgi:hypothetical protein